MTQKALAERVRISRQTMNAIENCRHAPTVAIAIRIADVFEVAVDQLFGLDYDGKPARDAQSATVALERSKVAIEKPIETEGHREPQEGEPKGEISLASLRGVIGT